SFKKIFGASSYPKFVENLTVTVGIRGTKLISYQDPDRQGFALKEGRLDVNPTGDQALNLERDGELKKLDGFDLEEGREINVSNGEVTESELSQASIDDFNRLEAFAGALLGGVLLADAASSSSKILVSTEGSTVPNALSGFESGQVAVSKSPAPLGANSTTATVTAGATGGGLGTIAGVAAAAGGLAGGGGGGSSSDPSGIDGSVSCTTGCRIASVDTNLAPDDLFHLYVNGVFIGEVANSSGTTIEHFVNLNPGENTVELRHMSSRGFGTCASFDINNGEFARDYIHNHENPTSYNWIISASESPET
ncbi:MAG: hypothetical protein AAF420_16295, partial [Pseudomonadota bacterium]